MNFQETTIIVATIVLILILSVIGYLLANNKSPKRFPPVASACPDYWISEKNSCVNPKGLGKSTPSCKGPKNFDTKHFKGHDASCLKAKWAKNCGLAWQGLTNDPDICKNKNTH